MYTVAYRVSTQGVNATSFCAGIQALVPRPIKCEQLLNYESFKSQQETVDSVHGYTYLNTFTMIRYIYISVFTNNELKT